MSRGARVSGKRWTGRGFRWATGCWVARCLVMGWLAAGLVATAAWAQSDKATLEPGWVHRHWTVEDGLPVNVLGRVLQARDGYLWIATFDGLVRFDGVRFTVYRTADVPALGSNRIISLEETEDGLWIRSETGGLVRLRDGIFERIELPQLDRYPSPTTFLLDRDGGLWIGSSDRVYRAGHSGVVSLDFQLPEGTRLQHFDFDPRGALWLGTSKGIAKFSDGELTWVHPASDVEGILPDGDRMLFFRRDTSPLEARAGRWREMTEEVAAGFRLHGTAGVRRRPWGGHFVLNSGRLLVLENGAVDVLTKTESRQAVLMAGVSAQGDHWWAADNQVVRNGEVVFTLPDGMVIRSLALDRDGTIWLTTMRSGLHALRPASIAVFGQPEGLPNEIVYSVFEDRAERLWIGTHGDGLWRLDDNGLTGFRRRGGDGYTSFPRSMVEDDRGRLWIGLLGGLYQVSGDEMVAAGELGEANITVCVNALLIDRADRLWVGTTAGLQRRVTGANGSGEWHSLHPEVLSRSDIRTLAEDDSGGLWVGTADGLARVSETGIQIVDRQSGLPSDLVRGLHVDDDGHLWVGTEDGGLARIEADSWEEPEGPEIFSVDVSHGLFSNGIHHILQDDLGFLWMSSNQGVFRVRKADLERLAQGQIERVESVGLTERDGMRNREANGGSGNAGAKSRDGRLWFATQAGVVVVDPESVLQASPAPPSPRVEQVRIDEETRPFPHSGIDLASTERTFSIEYSAITLEAAGRTRFRYRLVGFDDKWIDAGSRREAFFTRVPAGRYSFELESRIVGQDWSGVSVVRRISVEARANETWWFKTMVGMGALLLGFGVLKLQERRQSAHRLRLEALVDERTAVVAKQAEKLRELDQLKSDLFTNVSHEFRTPLTLTIGPLQDLLRGSRGPLPTAVEEDLQLALRSSHRVLDLINQILDVARLEAGHVRLRVEQLDLPTWLERRLDAFRPLAERDRIAVRFDPGPPLDDVFVDPQQLAKVVDNLLANAFRLTPDGGAVGLSVSTVSTDEFEIEVRDTGPGIPATELPKIFDRFHRGDHRGNAGQTGAVSGGRRRWAGTGIGLALAKEVVELHRGTLRAESVEGEGATFVLRLRRGNSHFSEEELIDASGIVERPDSLGRSEFGPRPEGAFGQQGHSDVEAPLEEKTTTQTEEPEEPEDRAMVLVVDDQREIRRYVRRQLKSNFHVVEAEDGVEALERARERTPDLVVSDVMMPKLDGFALAEALRADPELSFVPIILLTAKASMSSKLTGLREGIDDYLTKPFDGRELVARVRNLIDGRRRLLEHFEADKGVVLRLPAEDVQPADQSFLERLGDIIAERSSDPDFGVERLAEELRCDRTYLFRKLRELLDETPSGLIREVRLSRAAALLAAEVGSVSEIAYSVGFKSVSHFSQSFRRRFGKTPSEYKADPTVSASE